MKKILLFAAFVYFFLAPITYHPDNKLVLYWAGLERGRVWNIWTYGEQHFPNEGQFNYPPLHYYLDKLQYFLSVPIGGAGYDAWLSQSNSLDAYHDRLSSFSIAIKFVLILFGLGAGYLIYAIARKHHYSESQAKFASLLWLFNPITLYSIPVMGQNDVMSIVFFLMGWLLLNTSLPLASLIFGLGASIKIYPLLWLPFLLLPLPKLTPKQKIVCFLLSAFCYVGTLLPFITNANFRATVLNSGINERFLYAQIGFGFFESIYLIPLLLLLVFYAGHAIIEQKAAILPKTAFSLVVVNLILLGFSHFHPQWFTWLIPFWALWFASLPLKNRGWPLLSSLAAGGAWLLIILLFKDPSLTFGIFVPLNTALVNLPMLSEYLANKGVEVSTINNLAHTFLAGMSLIGIAAIVKWKELPVKESDPLTLPRVFASLSKVNRFIIALLLSFIGFWGLSGLSAAVPVALSSPPPTDIEYRSLTETVVAQFTAVEEYLSHITLYFDNPDLANKDSYTLKITAGSSTSPLLEQNFSGFNAGSPGTIRFDLPIQSASKYNTYTLQLVPLTTQFPPLKLGYQKQSSAHVAIQTFYQSPNHPFQIIENSFRAMRHIVSQQPLVYGVLIILLWICV